MKSPFRYPGSKAKLLPIIMEYINNFHKNTFPFAEAFVGGGSVALAVAEKYPLSRIYLNDKDYWIYCFWNIVAGTDSNKLSALLGLIDQPATIEQFYKLRGEATKDEIECAYKAIFFNRTCFSGILKSGPIGGKNQLSKYKVNCRYNSIKLKKNILACNKLLRGRTSVYNYDIIDFLRTQGGADTIYLDPPYYKQGKALYSEYMPHSEHVNMSLALKSYWKYILSYDDCPEIRSLYKDNKIIDLAARYSINGKKTTWENKNELIILNN